MARQINIPVNLKFKEQGIQNIKSMLSKIDVTTSAGGLASSKIRNLISLMNQYDRVSQKGITSAGDLTRLKQLQDRINTALRSYTQFMNQLSFQDLKLSPDQLIPLQKINEKIKQLKNSLSSLNKDLFMELYNGSKNIQQAFKTIKVPPESIKSIEDAIARLKRADMDLNQTMTQKKDQIANLQGIASIPTNLTQQGGLLRQMKLRHVNWFGERDKNGNSVWKAGYGVKFNQQLLNNPLMAGLSQTQRTKLTNIAATGTFKEYQAQLEKIAVAASKAREKIAELRDEFQTAAIKRLYTSQAIPKLEDQKKTAQKRRETTQERIDQEEQARKKLKANITGGFIQQANEQGEQLNHTLSGIKGQSESLKDQLNSKISSQNFLEEAQSRLQSLFGIASVIDRINYIVRNVIQQVKDLDKAITGIAVVTNFDTSQLWGQINTYMDMAKQYGVTTQGTYQVSQLYYQMGLATNQVMDLTSETLKMAAISSLDYATATDYMTVALRGFNIEASQATRIVDVYSELAAIAAADTAQIAEAMSKTASIAASAGMSFESTSTFLTMMIETTREAPQNLGTALKTIIARFQEMKENPMEIVSVDGEQASLNKVDAALKSVGIQLADTSGQFRNLDEVIFQLSGIWNTLDRNTQRWIANTVAGSRQQSRFIALMSDNQRLTQLYNAALDSQDSALIQYAKTMDSIEAKMNNLSTSFQGLYMQIYNGPVAKGILDFIQSLFNNLEQAQDAGGGFFGAIFDISMVAKIMSTLNMFSKMLIQHNYQMWQKIKGDALAAQQQIAQGAQSSSKTGLDKTNTNSKNQILSSIKKNAPTYISAIGAFLQPLVSGIAQMFGQELSDQVNAGLNIAGGVTQIAAGAALIYTGQVIPGIMSIVSGIGSLAAAVGFLDKSLEELNATAQKSQAMAATARKELSDLENAGKALKEAKGDAEATQQAMNNLANAFPELNATFDLEGNAVGDLTTAYERLIAVKRREAAQTQTKYLKDQTATINKELVQEYQKMGYNKIWIPSTIGIPQQYELNIQNYRLLKDFASSEDFKNRAIESAVNDAIGRGFTEEQAKKIFDFMVEGYEAQEALTKAQEQLGNKIVGDFTSLNDLYQYAKTYRLFTGNDETQIYSSAQEVQRPTIVNQLTTQINNDEQFSKQMGEVSSDLAYAIINSVAKSLTGIGTEGLQNKDWSVQLQQINTLFQDIQNGQYKEIIDLYTDSQQQAITTLEQLNELKQGSNETGASLIEDLPLYKQFVEGNQTLLKLTGQEFLSLTLAQQAQFIEWAQNLPNTGASQSESKNNKAELLTAIQELLNEADDSIQQLILNTALNSRLDLDLLLSRLQKAGVNSRLLIKIKKAGQFLDYSKNVTEQMTDYYYQLSDTLSSYYQKALQNNLSYQDMNKLVQAGVDKSAFKIDEFTGNFGLSKDTLFYYLVEPLNQQIKFLQNALKSDNTSVNEEQLQQLKEFRDSIINSITRSAQLSLANSLISMGTQGTLSDTDFSSLINQQGEQWAQYFTRTVDGYEFAGTVDQYLSMVYSTMEDMFGSDSSIFRNWKNTKLRQIIETNITGRNMTLQDIDQQIEKINEKLKITQDSAQNLSEIYKQQCIILQQQRRILESNQSYLSSDSGIDPGFTKNYTNFINSLPQYVQDIAELRSTGKLAYDTMLNMFSNFNMLDKELDGDLASRLGDLSGSVKTWGDALAHYSTVSQSGAMQVTLPDFLTEQALGDFEQNTEDFVQANRDRWYIIWKSLSAFEGMSDYEVKTRLGFLFQVDGQQVKWQMPNGQVVSDPTQLMTWMTNNISTAEGQSFIVPFFSQLGIKVDENLNFIDENGNPITDLFAHVEKKLNDSTDAEQLMTSSGATMITDIQVQVKGTEDSENVSSGIKQVGESSASAQKDVLSLQSAMNDASDAMVDTDRKAQQVREAFNTVGQMSQSAANRINNLRSMVSNLVTGFARAAQYTKQFVNALRRIPQQIVTRVTYITTGRQQSAAQGTSGAKGGPTLVGQLGPELRVSDGEYSIVGKTGAQFINLKRGDIIFDAQKTKRLMAGKSGVRGKALAYGNSGPALASGAQYARKEYQRWNSILSQISGLLNRGGGGSGGGGGGGGSSSQYEMDLERWFNWLRQIEQLENKITILRAKRQNFDDGEKYAKALYEENAYLKRQAEIYQDLAKSQTEYRKTLQKNILQNYGKYFYLIGDALQINYDAIKQDTINNQQLGQQLDNIMQQYMDTNEQIAQNTEAYTKNQTQIKENIKTMRKAYTDMEDEILDALQNMYDRQIALQEEQLEKKKEADSKYLDALRKNLDKQKEMRDKQNTQENKAQLQRRIALLQRDTSGANIKQIQSLKQQLKQMQEDQYWTGREDSINSIEEAMNNQYETLQSSIDTLTEINEYKLQNMELYWNEVNNIVAQGATAISDFLKTNSAEFLQSSKMQQEDYMETWRFTIDQALTYLKNKQTMWDEIIYGMQNSITQGNPNGTGNGGSGSGSGNGSSGGSSGGSGSGGSGGSGGGSGSGSGGSSKKWYVRGGPSVLGPYKSQSQANSAKNSKISSAQAQVNRILSAMQTQGTNVRLQRQLTTYKNQLSAWKQSYVKYITGYSKGGLVDYTGLAMVHGSESKPESFLNAEHTKILMNILQYAKDIRFKQHRQISSGMDVDGQSTTNIDKVEVIIESGVIDNNADAQALGTDIAKALMDIAKKSGNISVTRY